MVVEDQGPLALLFLVAMPLKYLADNGTWVTIIGIAQFSGTDTVPEGNAVSADDAVLGGPEYGSRD
mgnify:CR=1 FL=1